jgi:hypothetical protein
VIWYLSPEVEVKLAEAVGFQALNVSLYRQHEGDVRISALAHHVRRPRYWQRREPWVASAGVVLAAPPAKSSQRSGTHEVLGRNLW